MKQFHKDRHHLTCQYRRHHPMFYISPLKEEVMFLKPRIVVFHDCLSDKEISKVKELATPRVKRNYELAVLLVLLGTYLLMTDEFLG